MALDSPVRLQAYLARCGIGSRRECDRLIEAGLVQVNGRFPPLGEKVDGSEIITVREKRVFPQKTTRYIALNKPAGYICANADPYGRPLASELFANTIRERLFHVGRLDLLSEGLLFYTNDGAFARTVTHPSSRIEKEYLVESPGRIEAETLDLFCRGVEYQGVRYRIDGYTQKGAHQALIRLHEGKRREIRELFRSAGYQVRSLKRIRIGIVGLKGIESGGYRNLNQHEIEWFTNRNRLP